MTCAKAPAPQTLSTAVRINLRVPPSTRTVALNVIIEFAGKMISQKSVANTTFFVGTRAVKAKPKLQVEECRVSKFKQLLLFGCAVAQLCRNDRSRMQRTCGQDDN
jgi:hypothetical protein